jgi:hypothetical protein
MTSYGSMLEKFLVDLLDSWTALELAVSHFEGQYREAQERKHTLLVSLAEAIVSEQFSAVDVGEFINEYMLEQFSMELGDDSHIQIAGIMMEGWKLVKQGIQPQLPKRINGASMSTINDQVQETSDVEDEDIGDSSNRPVGSRIVTDEDGWSTVVPR